MPHHLHDIKASHFGQRQCWQWKTTGLGARVPSEHVRKESLKTLEITKVMHTQKNQWIRESSNTIPIAYMVKNIAYAFWHELNISCFTPDEKMHTKVKYHSLLHPSWEDNALISKFSLTTQHDKHRKLLPHIQPHM
jgi:hypothetical protein